MGEIILDYKTEDVLLMQGDCLKRLKELPDNSVDMIMTRDKYNYEDLAKEIKLVMEDDEGGKIKENINT